MTDSQEKKIVVGVDGSDSSKAALVWGLRQARLTGAPLQVVMAWDYPLTYGWMVVPEGVDLGADAASELERVVKEVTEAENAADPAVEITNNVIQGHPAVVLMTEAENAALVVVGSRGHGEFAGMLLGSVSEHLSTHAPCPVLIVRD
ncbi:MAG: universal stress protein [Acidimicrobiales bacterium]